MCDKNELNDFYKKVYENALKISLKLNELGYKNKICFCNKNYELVDNKWICNYFPIPVIELKQIDLNLDLFDKPNYFELFLNSRQIKNFDFQKLLSNFNGHNLAIYDGIDCLQDIYKKGMKVEKLNEELNALRPKKIGISFETSKQITNITKDLKIILSCFEK